MLVHAGVPLRSQALFWAAVIYTISPVDLVPDPVYLDDIGVLLLALRALNTMDTASRALTGSPSAPTAARASHDRMRG